MPVTRWNDDRLDGLQRQIEKVTPVITDVAVIKAELRGLRRELTDNTSATHELSAQIEKAQLEPLNRWQTWRSAATIAVIGAAVSGTFVLIGVLISSR